MGLSKHLRVVKVGVALVTKGKIKDKQYENGRMNESEKRKCIVVSEFIIVTDSESTNPCTDDSYCLGCF